MDFNDLERVDKQCMFKIYDKWPEIAKTYADVNHIFGDIVKVTPSSKVASPIKHTTI